MGATEFSDHVAEVVVGTGVVDRPVVRPVRWGGAEPPYLPTHSLEGWANTLFIFSERLEEADPGTAYFLRRAAQNVTSARMQYETKWGKHKNGPAPTNPQEK
jgi:hypothetical protein